MLILTQEGIERIWEFYEDPYLTDEESETDSILRLVLISLICTVKVIAKIEDALLITVGDKAITKSDIVDEIKIILILNNESYSDDKKEKLHQQAINSTIKRK